MKIFGTIVLSIGVLIGALLLYFFSACALDRHIATGDRTVYAAFALLDLAAMAASVWAIGKLNRK